MKRRWIPESSLEGAVTSVQAFMQIYQQSCCFYELTFATESVLIMDMLVFNDCDSKPCFRLKHGSSLC